MKRAAVLGVALLGSLGGVPAGAQQARKVYRVGILSGRTLTVDRPLVDSFRRTMAAQGYREGQNLAIDYRGASEDFTRLPEIAVELARSKPDAIVAAGSRTTAAAKRATTSIPIVMTENENPVAAGFVTSLARPGGNVTGTTLIDLSGKLLQLAEELVPHVRRLAVIGDANLRDTLVRWRAMEGMTRPLEIQIMRVGIRSNDAAEGLSVLPHQHVDAAIVLGDAVTVSNAKRIVRLVAAQRLPAVYSTEAFAAVDGLVVYAASSTAIWSQAAIYVDRIFKGAKPADLPVERPTTFDLIVNLRTAREIGLTVTQSILLQATQVIR